MNSIKLYIELENNSRIDFEVYPEVAPETVSNFLNLVDSGFYTGTIFHRIIKGFMSQCGGYFVSDNQLIGKELDYSIKGEFAQNGFNNTLRHELGVFSMARTSDPNSASSQFFICDESCSFLDGQYATFGKITSDTSVPIIRKLNATPTQNYPVPDFPAVDLKDVTIRKICRIEE